MEKVSDNEHVLHNICDAKDCPVFACLSVAETAYINDYKSCMSYKKGQFIFHEKSYPLGIYCVCSGKIKIVRTGKDNKSQIVRMVTNGNLVGFRALLSDTRYQENAIALEDTTLCFIPKAPFFNVLKSNSRLSSAIIKLLTFELEKVERNVTSLAQKLVKERIAEVLILLKDTYGLEEDGMTINVVLSREEIASLAGTATETVIRLLGVFKQSGILDFSGKKIMILDMDRLIEEAGADPP